MSINNPFGPGGPYHDPFKREREMADMIRRAMGPGYELQQRLKELEGPLAHLKDLQRTGVLSTAYAAIYRNQPIEKLQALTTPAWASSVSETARSMLERDRKLVEQQRQTSATLLDTIRAFDANGATIAAALARAQTGSTYQRAISDLLPQVSQFSAIAERMSMINIEALARDEVTAAATRIAAEMVAESQRIVEAITVAPTEADSAALFSQLFELVATGVAKLGANTLTELNNMGLMQWSNWLIAVLSIILAWVAMQPQLSAAQQAALDQLTQKYEGLEQDNTRLLAAADEASEGFLDRIPRAQLSRNAKLRRMPERAADVVLRLHEGDVVAVESKQRRWCRVIFRDPLSGQLARAWIFGSALTFLTHPLED